MDVEYCVWNNPNSPERQLKIFRAPMIEFGETTSASYDAYLQTARKSILNLTKYESKELSELAPADATEQSWDWEL